MGGSTCSCAAPQTLGLYKHLMEGARPARLWDERR
jgi:hypothetical protein